ncbi:MAG: hypothetical protein ACREJ2_03180 [Planctomycetota bacterium]
MTSWKTTTCGILALIAAAITLVAMPMLDNDPNTNPNWAGLGAAVMTAAGLFFAKDHSADATTATPSAPAPAPVPTTAPVAVSPAAAPAEASAAPSNAVSTGANVSLSGAQL